MGCKYAHMENCSCAFFTRFSCPLGKRFSTCATLLILLPGLSSNYAPLCLSLHFKFTLNYWFHNIPFHPLAKLANLGPIEPARPEAAVSRVPSLLHSVLRLVLEVSPPPPSTLCQVPRVNSVPVYVPSRAGAAMLLAPDLVNRVLRLCPSTSGLVSTLSWLDASLNGSAPNTSLSIISPASHFLEASLRWWTLFQDQPHQTLTGPAGGPG